MPSYTMSDVHVNRPLTDISVAYAQKAEQFVANKVFPMIPVAKQSDLYYSYSKDSWLRLEAAKRAPCTESRGASWDLSTESYFAHVFALHHDVCDQLRANQDAAIDLDRDATLYLTTQMLMQKDADFAARFMVGASWPGNTDTATNLGGLWTASTADPISQLRKAQTDVQRVTGFRPNVAVLGREAWDALQDNVNVLNRIQFNQLGIVSKELVAAAAELDALYVIESVANSAAEGVTASVDFTGGTAASKSCLLVYRPARPSLLEPSAGYNFTWTGLLGSGDMGFRIKSYRLERNAATRVEAEMAYDQKLVAADLGYLITACVA